MYNFKKSSRIVQRFIWNITKNTRIQDQISFWRLKDMKNKIMPMSAVRYVKVKKMGEILFKNYIMRVARAFWKIDRAQDDYEKSENSTVIMNKKYGAQAQMTWNENFSDKKSILSPQRVEKNFLHVPESVPRKKKNMVSFPLDVDNDGLRTPQSDRIIKVENKKERKMERVKSTSRIEKKTIKKQVVLLPP